uniref:Uncharacterized protein n=1 Tax=Aegilops tauschii subsp. strangulata TaxID=200361 RepID=A0A453MB05_AEGTS
TVHGHSSHPPPKSSTSTATPGFQPSHPPSQNRAIFSPPPPLQPNPIDGDVETPPGLRIRGRPAPATRPRPTVYSDAEAERTREGCHGGGTRAAVGGRHRGLAGAGERPLHRRPRPLRRLRAQQGGRKPSTRHPFFFPLLNLYARVRHPAGRPDDSIDARRSFLA